MEKFKAQKTSEKIFTVLLTILLFAFLGLVFYVNLSCNPEYYDGDIYADIQYAKEAWKAKSLFPSNWIFGNQTYVVATPVLAALIYGIIGNAITAMAIASCIMTVLVVLTYDWMMRTVFSYNQRISGFLTLAAVGLLCGHVATTRIFWQLFFTMASYYACYIITAFIVYGCYIRIKQHNFKKKHIAVAAVSVGLSFGTGMQSLRQTAVMVLPLIACEILLIIIDSIKAKKIVLTKSAIFTVIIAISNFSGLIVMKLIPINQSTEYLQQKLVSGISEILKNIRTYIRCMLFIFASDDIGFHKNLAICLLFFAIIFVTIIFCINEVVKNKFELNEKAILMILFGLGVASVFAASVLLTMLETSSYFFMGYPLLAISVAYLIQKMRTKSSIVYIVISIFAVGMFSVSTATTVKEVSVGKSDKTAAYRISEYMLDNGYESLYACLGFNQQNKGGEDVVVVSNDKIKLACFKSFKENNNTLEPVKSICVKDNYKSFDNEKSLYLLRNDEYDIMREIADDLGIEMTVVQEYYGYIFLCKMSENIFVIAQEQK